MEACLKLAVKVLNKTMDSTTPTPEKMEFTTITRVNGKVMEEMIDSLLFASGTGVSGETCFFIYAQVFVFLLCRISAPTAPE